MKIKQNIIFALFILFIQMNLRPFPALAQTEEDIRGVKDFIQEFFEKFYQLDSAGVIADISTKYRCIATDGKHEEDYAEVTSRLRKIIDEIPKTYIDNYFSDLEILKADIKDGNASVTVRFSLKRFNLDISQDEVYNIRHFFSLVKEDGSWKITKWMKSKSP